MQSTQCCISDLKDWMTNSKLQLNEHKTGIILILPKKVLNNVPLPSKIRQSGTNIKLSQTVCKLSITLDQTLSFQQHISNVCNTCYLEPGRISTIHHLSKGATNTLICAFILSRLDYCSALLSGSQKHLLDRLQKVQNNTAQLIYRSSKFSHVTPLLHIYTGSQLKQGLISNSLHFALNLRMALTLPLRPSSSLLSFSAAPFFCRHLSVQNTMLLHKVKWLVLFLLPSSNNMEQAPCLYPSCILCQFFQIFLENLSLFKKFFFSLLP